MSLEGPVVLGAIGWYPGPNPGDGIALLSTRSRCVHGWVVMILGGVMPGLGGGRLWGLCCCWQCGLWLWLVRGHSMIIPLGGGACYSVLVGRCASQVCASYCLLEVGGANMLPWQWCAIFFVTFGRPP